MNKLAFIIIVSILLVSCKTQQTIEDIGFIQPEFEIISIYIIQADLVNTEFEAILKIDNPNIFDLQLLSIKYRLHGNGMLWAEGVSETPAEESILVPAESSTETKFRFSMNFINMNRRLLDDVITMRRIQYNFKGEAQIQANIPRTNPYNISFDISGLSDVKPRAN